MGSRIPTADRRHGGVACGHQECSSGSRQNRYRHPRDSMTTPTTTNDVTTSRRHDATTPRRHDAAQQQRPTDGTNERPTDGTNERTNERTHKRTTDRPTERTNERTKRQRKSNNALSSPSVSHSLTHSLTHSSVRLWVVSCVFLWYMYNPVTVFSGRLKSVWMRSSEWRSFLRSVVMA